MHPYIYLSVVIALLVVAISFVILRYTKFGRAVFAVGGNEQSALLMGLNPKVTKLKVYVLNGFLASLAGFAFCLNSCGGFVEQARGFEMDAIAAAVIGGTLLTGGVGTVVGSLFGSLIKGIIETIITFQGTLSSWWTRIVIALLLCFFVILQSVFKSIRECAYRWFRPPADANRNLVDVLKEENNMNNMPKTKIGIVAVSRDCFPESLSVTRREALIKAYKEKYDPEDIYECPVCIVESEIHMVQALEDIKKAGCDALVVYLGNFGPEISETLLAKHFDGPKMFVAAAEESGDSKCSPPRSARSCS